MYELRVWFIAFRESWIAKKGKLWEGIRRRLSLWILAGATGLRLCTTTTASTWLLREGADERTSSIEV